MSGKDDPFGANGRTVIRPTPGGVPRPGGTPQSGAPAKPATPLRSAPIPPVPPPRTPLVPHGMPGATPAPGPGVAPGHGVKHPAPDAWMQGQSAGQPAFPDVLQPQNVPEAEPIKKIPLEVALNARDGADISSANPMTAAATSLLILLGRLRLLIVEMQAMPLMTHVANSITEFEKRALDSGVSKEDALVAKYILCGTADDIVQNLPGTDRHVWMQYSMLAQFFKVRTSGVGFFEELNKVLANPAPRYDLLELMHACLCLGFEGQYRGAAGGDVELQRIRRDVYQALRHLKARSDDDISPRWRGIEIKIREFGSRVPLWAICSFAAVALFGMFLLFRLLLGNDSEALADTLVTIHPGEMITIERAAFAPLPDIVNTNTSQLQRIRDALKKEIDVGTIAVDPLGEHIVVSVSNLILFASGKADVKKEFAEVATRIAAALDPELGPIFIFGHTDNIKTSPTSRYKSNFDLSQQRAKSVADIVGKGISDAARLVVEGKGADEPVTSNKTREGRAKNRRVEILIQREETLDDTQIPVLPTNGSN
jgi:type VI secretion system protein ImpK